MIEILLRTNLIPLKWYVRGCFTLFISVKTKTGYFVFTVISLIKSKDNVPTDVINIISLPKLTKLVFEKLNYLNSLLEFLKNCFRRRFNGKKLIESFLGFCQSWNSWKLLLGLVWQKLVFSLTKVWKEKEFAPFLPVFYSVEKLGYRRRMKLIRNQSRYRIRYSVKRTRNYWLLKCEKNGFGKYLNKISSC